MSQEALGAAIHGKVAEIVLRKALALAELNYAARPIVYADMFSGVSTMANAMHT